MFYTKKYFKYIVQTGKIVQHLDPKIYGLLMAFVSTLASLILILFINKYYGNLLNIDFGGNEQITTENKILKNEILKLTKNYKDLNYSIKNLTERDNQLRMAVNLPTVSDEELELGTGGSLNGITNNINSDNLEGIISASGKLISEMKKQIEFQRESYSEIYSKSLTDKKYLESIPAIQPMSGVLIRHGNYGMRIHPILNIRKMHEGIDINNSVGTAVYASGSGVVKFSGNSSTGYGVSIHIDHGFEFETIYAHLSKVLVHKNQKVKRGDLIAYSGNSGLSSGPHLHYEVRYKEGNVNPVNYFFDDKPIIH